MRVGVLGPLLVDLGDREVAPAGQRRRDVIAVLLQRRGRVVPAEVLLDLVWADRAADLTAAAVHTVVARIRRQLGREAIATRAEGYVLPGTVTTDEDLFGDLAEDARRCRRAGDPGAAARHYRAALAVWRGDEAYGHVTDELVEADRSRLAEQRALVAEDLTALLVDHPLVGEPGESARRAAELIVHHPLRERGYQLAMLAAYADHRQADALDTFVTLRRRLRDELGIDPTADTRRLHRRILDHDPTLVRPSGPEHPPPPPSGPGGPYGRQGRRPPVPTTALVGREPELDRLRTELASGRRLTTLVGPAGVGKSRLLAEVARWQPASLPSAYVEMAAPNDPGADEVAEAIAAAYGLPIPREGQVDALATALAVGQRLLLVDEAEWAGESLAAVVGTLLRRCPGLLVVVASRQPTDVPGELVMPVDPLPEPAAVELLTARMADRAVAVGGDPETASLLTEIVHRLDGVPLALELAAGQVGARSLAEVAALAVAPLELTAPEPASVRHRSLRAALSWSIDRLEEPQRVVLLRVAVFAGSFDLDAARAVSGPVPGDAAADEIVRELVRRALVQVDVRSARALEFRLLRTVRDLALESSPVGEREAARARHRSWYADRWRGQPRRDDLVADVRDQHEDYVEALRSALEARDADSLAALTLTVSRFWVFTRSKGPGLRWIGRVLASGVLPSRDAAVVRTHRAALSLHHDSDMVLDDTEAAIAALRERDDAAALVTAHMLRALELDGLGRRPEAVGHSAQAVAIARATSLERTADALGVHAYATATAGHHEDARAALAEAETLLDVIGSTVARIAVSSNLALAWFELDESARALAILDRADRLVPSMLGVTPLPSLVNTGWAALGVGDGDRALGCFVDALPPAGAPPDRMTSETCLGAAAALGRIGHRHAALALGGAVELAERLDHPPSPGQRREVERARARAGHASYPSSPDETDASFADRLVELLRRVGSSPRTD